MWILRTSIVVGLAWSLACSWQAVQASDMGVSISVAQPGFYGRIDLGSAGPAPRLIYPEPVWGQGRPHQRHHPQRMEPWYLHVPPAHARHWVRHCGHYGACGRPVYFVQEGWYREAYGPRRGRGHGHSHDRAHEHGHLRGHGHER